MEAPDKIFLERILCSNEVYDTWKSQKTISDDIEYTRMDAFIEKSCEWLRDNYLKYPSEDGADTVKFVTDFKKYMKGE